MSTRWELLGNAKWWKHFTVEVPPRPRHILMSMPLRFPKKGQYSFILLPTRGDWRQWWRIVRKSRATHQKLHASITSRWTPDVWQEQSWVRLLQSLEYQLVITTMTELETLAVVWAISHFNHFLYWNSVHWPHVCEGSTKVTKPYSEACPVVDESIRQRSEGRQIVFPGWQREQRSMCFLYLSYSTATCSRNIGWRRSGIHLLQATSSTIATQERW